MAQICIPKNIVNQIKKTIPSKNVYDLAEMKPEQAKTKISEIVDALYKTDDETKSLLRSALEKEIVTKQQMKLERYLPADLKKQYRLKREMGVLEDMKARGDAQEFIDKQKAKIDKIQSQVPKDRVVPTFVDKMAEASRLSDFNDELYQEVVKAKVGLDIPQESIEKIYTLSQKVDESKKLFESDPKNKEARVQYGHDLIDLNEYVESVKPKPFQQVPEDATWIQKSQIWGKDLAKEIPNIANVPRALLSTLDLSGPGRQGLGMVSRPEYWKNLGTMIKVAASEENYKNMKAEIITRESYDLMQKSGLRITGIGEKITGREEAFMTNILDKVPLIKIPAGASERAYAGFLSKLRADVFDDLVQKAKLAGEDITDINVTTQIADTVNSFTGAGKFLNQSYTPPIVNGMFFSPRKLQATLDMFNPGTYMKSSSTARKAAQRNMVGMIGTAVTLAGIGAMTGGEVETDPRSSDFGKVKFGNTRFDLTGGNANFAVLLARVFSGQTKSSTSDIMYELDGSFGDNTRADAVVKWFRNKAAPTTSYFIDMLYGENAIGETFNAKEGLIDRAIPLILSDTIETYQEEGLGSAFTSGMSNFFGVGASTYGYSGGWEDKDTKEMKSAKKQLGEGTFKEMSIKYDRLVNSEYDKIIGTDEYEVLSNDEKKELTREIRNKAKKEIFREYRVRSAK